MDDDAIKKIFDAGDTSRRVTYLEKSKEDHEARIRRLEDTSAHMDEKLDTIIEQTKGNSSAKLSWKQAVFSVVGSAAGMLIVYWLLSLMK